MAAKAHKVEISTNLSAYSERMQDVIHSLKLEGISLSEESLHDLKLVDEGKLSKEDALKRVLARVKAKKH